MTWVPNVGPRGGTVTSERGGRCSRRGQWYVVRPACRRPYRLGHRWRPADTEPYSVSGRAALTSGAAGMLAQIGMIGGAVSDQRFKWRLSGVAVALRSRLWQEAQVVQRGVPLADDVASECEGVPRFALGCEAPRVQGVLRGLRA
jgi:hypothetical protein